MKEKLSLLQSIGKGAYEDSQAYLVRIRCVVSLLASDQIPTGSILELPAVDNVWVRILFLFGLDDIDDIDDIVGLHILFGAFLFNIFSWSIMASFCVIIACPWIRPMVLATSFLIWAVMSLLSVRCPLPLVGEVTEPKANRAKGQWRKEANCNQGIT